MFLMFNRSTGTSTQVYSMLKSDLFFFTRECFYTAEKGRTLVEVMSRFVQNVYLLLKSFNVSPVSPLPSGKSVVQ
jgi:hypothetical protein